MSETERRTREVAEDEQATYTLRAKQAAERAEDCRNQAQTAWVNYQSVGTQHDRELAGHYRQMFAAEASLAAAYAELAGLASLDGMAK